MDSESLGLLQARIAQRVAQSKAERAAQLATMPEFCAFLDALRDVGIVPAHVSVTREGMTIEWGERLRDDRPECPQLFSPSTFNAALAAGAIPITRARNWGRNARR